ncbi:hypothetical protein Calag_0495 [Caldisphaera lagunensis DSM 15908]|uniref:Uncharacterized protein n=1 Tax=Caldisphaera lagunensis (strain DSM 15908 / JCM 11604 / ANMR 0165 / IC-154) TaxID=1056495 RepID=L0A8T6_CALLD|nr:hypothetical protein [Caldisphaera lagunensis]AFZ70261.1 hypothetical protein Calag_0495 [Caldisphaera lagunensis DSM 15908]
MSESQLVNRLETLSKSMSRKKGLSSIASVSVINILNIINRIEEINKYVECLSSNKNLCNKTDKGVLCSSDCSNTYRLVNGNETKIWKTGSNAFGFTLSSDYIELGIKDTKIEITQDKVNIKIYNNLISFPLDESGLLDNNPVIMNATNKIDEVIRHAYNGISSCARNLGLRC